MFDSVGWGEILVVVLAALFIFGPERLPTLARDAARALRRVRAALSEVRSQAYETFGDDLAELRDLDLRGYDPKTFLRDQLFSPGQFDPPLGRGADSNGARPAGGLGDNPGR